MKKATLFIYTLCVLGLSHHASASETKIRKHTFGGATSAGSAKYKGSSADGGGILQLYGFYNYKLTPNFELEVGISGGAEVDDWSCSRDSSNDWVCRSDNKPIFNIQADSLNYQNAVFAIKSKFPLTRRNSLYGKLGGHYFDYEFKRGSTKLDNDSGFGFVAEAGWQYQFANGLTINAGYQYLDMKDLDISNLSTGLSYSF